MDYPLINIHLVGQTQNHPKHTHYLGQPHRAHAVRQMPIIVLTTSPSAVENCARVMCERLDLAHLYTIYICFRTFALNGWYCRHRRLSSLPSSPSSPSSIVNKVIVPKCANISRTRLSRSSRHECLCTHNPPPHPSRPSPIRTQPSRCNICTVSVLIISVPHASCVRFIRACNRSSSSACGRKHACACVAVSSALRLPVLFGHCCVAK